MPGCRMTDDHDSATDRDEDDGQQSPTVERTYVFGDPPPADVYYREQCEDGETRVHETRDAIEMPASTVRVDIEERYEPGITRRKLAAVPGVFGALGLVVAATPITILWLTNVEGYAFSAIGSYGSLDLIFAGPIVLLECVFVLLLLVQLRRTHQLRADARMSPLEQPIEDHERE